MEDGRGEEPDDLDLYVEDWKVYDSGIGSKKESFCCSGEAQAWCIADPESQRFMPVGRMRVPKRGTQPDPVPLAALRGQGSVLAKGGLVARRVCETSTP